MLNIKATQIPGWLAISGVPGGIRTPDRRIRSPMLYPAELLGLFKRSEAKFDAMCLFAKQTYGTATNSFNFA